MNISENNIPDTNVKLIAIAAYHKYEMEYQDASGGLNQLKKFIFSFISEETIYEKHITYIISYYVILCYIILYYTILYFTILYYIIL